MAYLDDYKEIEDILKPVIILWLKRIYVLAGNFYAWFWLIREIFFRESSTLEDYVMWFFLTCGFYWFILEHPEIFFKIKKNE
ncbi:MAG: hypothetical protein LIO77_01915 [Rikenellaceae bacterium]|nr:hypothetical protein [Rikenellaceae bacterium]